MRLGTFLGRIQFLRGKSQWYLETLRAWVTPAAAAGAYAKYLGLSASWSIGIAIGLPVTVEFFGFFLGRFLYNEGGVAEEYRLAAEKDIYKVKQIAYQDAALPLLREIAASANRPCWERYAAKDDWATAPNRRPDER